MINPHAGVALYAQLAEIVREDILTGRLAPGQKLPSETALMQQHRVARSTARKAVAVLRGEGLVVVPRGQGAFVRMMPEIQDLAVAAGSTVTARMPTAAERGRYGVDEGVPLFVVAGPDGVVEMYPADRWRLRLPS